MTTSTHGISMRHLRQFAEPLRAIKDDAVFRLIERFDLLIVTAIKKPAEELIRLELILATIEARKSIEKANQRLLNAYVGLKNISELDSRCYAQVRLLISIPDIDYSDPLGISEEISKELHQDYNDLLCKSADHFTIAHKILGALTNYNPVIAIDFADKLNTAERRDEAFGVILRIYTDREPTKIDLIFVEETLKRIVNKSNRDVIFVKILKRASEKDWFNIIPQTKKMISEIPNLLNPVDRCFAFAYVLHMLAGSKEIKTFNNKFDKLIESWELVDREWQRVDIGYQIIAILANRAQDKARVLLDLITKEKDAKILANQNISNLYIQTIRLCLRTFSDVLKEKDYLAHRKKLIVAIQRIPSIEIRCQLLADLALRHFLGGKEQEFKLLVQEHIINTLDYCREHNLDDVRKKIIIKIAPCLYEFERELLKAELDQLEYSNKDIALRKVVKYILSNRSLSDPVDLDKLAEARTIDFKEALKVCEILKLMEVDNSIYISISALVNMLIKPDPKDREHDKCIIPEKQALTIAKNLSSVVMNLPETPQNIKHDGYKLVCLANIAKLRSFSISRASDAWNSVAPLWSDLSSKARDIPNLADKILVMIWVGEIMFKSDPNLGKSLLEDAGKLINDIPTIIDRGSRLQGLASAWKSIKDENAAKYFLKEAMTILQDWNWDRDRDQLTGVILQQAHSLDPEFAASLTSLVDNPYIENEMESFLKVRDLCSRPEKDNEKIDNLNELIEIRGRASANLLVNTCSGKQEIVREEKIANWVQDAFNGRFNDAYFTNAWFIQNSLSTTSQKSGPTLTELFMGLLDNLQVIFLATQVLFGVENRDVQFKYPELPDGLQLFPYSSTDEALKGLIAWIDSNVSKYIKIYDPYFKPVDMKVITSIPKDVHVHILTLRKSQVDLRDDEKVKEEYERIVTSLFGESFPEIHVYIFGTKSTGDGPFHDRYYIANGNKGIQIGTSVGGLGNKDSAIREMLPDETAKLEAEYIDSMIVSPPSYYREERLLTLRFTLHSD
jgi:hypothetical protein